MKILQLRFKNLNSLYGEWQIDFSKPVYQNEGIFAIIGPTGAGKSTILDALCLALYGRTPRLAKVNRGSNEIMSRHSGECYAEVTFSTTKGIFRSYWSQHRAHRKARGRLADYRHELADAENGTIIESKRSLTARLVAEKTGMDFDRFTRSILLAQGSFDTFLKADSDQRAPILERITGTSIYSEISVKTHERKSREQNRLELLQAELAGIDLLDQEQKREIKEQLTETESREKELARKQKELNEKLNWLQGIEKIRSQLTALEKEATTAATAIRDFEADKKRLNQAVKAASLEAQYTTLVSLRTRRSKLEDRKDETTARIDSLTRQHKTEQATLIKTENILQQKKDEQQKLQPILTEVRELDQQMAERHLQLEKERTQGKEIARERQRQEMEIKEAGRQQQEQEDARASLIEYKQRHYRDELLVTELTGLTRQLQRIERITADGIALKKKLDDSKKLIKKEQQELAQLQENEASQRKLLEQTAANLVAKEKSLKDILSGKSRGEYLTELEYLQNEIMYLQKIQSLEEERERLVAGSPCPLCGATEHPFGNDKLPGKNEQEKKLQKIKDIIKQLDSVEKDLQLSGREKDKQKLQLANLRGELREATARLGAAKENSRLLGNEREQKKHEFTTIQQEITPVLQELAIVFTPEKLKELGKTLATRQKKWLEVNKALGEFDEAAQKLLARKETALALYKEADKQQRYNQQQQRQYKAELAELREKRTGLLGSRIATEVEKELNSELGKHEKQLEKCRQTFNTTDKKLGQLQSLLAELKKETGSLQAKLLIQENEFSAACRAAHFPDEPAFLAAKMEQTALEQLQNQEKRLQENITAITARLEDQQKQLTIEEGKNLTSQSIAELSEELEPLTEKIQSLVQQLGACKQQLKDNEQAEQKISKKLGQIEAQKKELAKWKRLHQLIGSNDGKKYRNFAQGLTFEIMVQHANKQLKRMSERYLLIRDTANPLELNVIDNYQAGEQRSTQNLSGGESFIISLALALGLSSMASKHIRVDSLFLDEGFGTLDEEALEIALTALSSLQQDNKLIGVISHVQQLQDRISNQIRVIPGPGGKATLTGIGCKKID